MSVTSKALDTTKHSEKTAELIVKFASKVIGQPDATTALTNALDKYDSGLYDRTKPIACLLFLGPTGTGKTVTVEAFVETLFGSPEKMFKIDCAEFQHSHEIAKLIGSPPGYLGHRETHAVLTTEKIRQMQLNGLPFSIILFDEIEKASDALWNLLLGILDKGRLTLGNNETVDLASTIIIMTSNVGSKDMADKAGDNVLGFLTPTEEDASQESLRDTAVSAARKKFMPEFLNRLDSIVMFNTLTKDNLKEILDLELYKLSRIILAHSIAKVSLVVTPSAKAQLLKEGYDKKYGARHLKRVVEKHVLLPLTRTMASQQLHDLDTVVVGYEKGEFHYIVEFNL